MVERIIEPYDMPEGVKAAIHSLERAMASDGVWTMDIYLHNGKAVSAHLFDENAHGTLVKPYGDGWASFEYEEVDDGQLP